MTKPTKNIQGQDFKETVIFDEKEIQAGQLKVQVEGYPLQQSDFLILSLPGEGFHGWSRRLLLIGIGTIIVLFAKIIDFFIEFYVAEDKNDVVIAIESYELISVALTLIFCLVLFLIGLKFKNRKEKLVDKISNFFNSTNDE